MKVTSIASYEDLNNGALLGRTAMMIDSLRASSTIITAASNGCDRIVPTSGANEAAAIKKISEGSVLLCGEIGAKKVSGFDLGNSPLEYTQEAVEGRVLIYSTSNGSVAVKALAEAEDVLIGTFINATAAAKVAYALERDIMLVCAGTKGQFSTDDVVALGCIVSRLTQMDDTIEVDDLGKVAYRIYHNAKANIMGALEGSSNYEYLKGLQLFDDLEYCTREDMFDIVPAYKEGVIVKFQ